MPPRENHAGVSREVVYEAEYDTKCEVCCEMIEVGDEIVLVGEGWIHLECDER